MIRRYCPPGKVLISDKFSGNWQLTAGNCFSKPYVSKKTEPFVSAEVQRAASVERQLKKQFGRKIVIPMLCWRKAWGTWRVGPA